MATDKNLLTKAEQMEKVKKNPFAIRYIENPTEAPKKDYKKKIIKWIENPTEAVQFEAVKENPTEEIKMEAVKQNPEAIKEIKNPTRTVLEYLKLTKKDNKVIEYIKKIINKVFEYLKLK